MHSRYVFTESVFSRKSLGKFLKLWRSSIFRAIDVSRTDIFCSHSEHNRYDSLGVLCTFLCCPFLLIVSVWGFGVLLNKDFVMNFGIIWDCCLSALLFKQSLHIEGSFFIFFVAAKLQYVNHQFTQTPQKTLLRSRLVRLLLLTV